MKKHVILLSLAALATAGLVSCADEEPSNYLREGSKANSISFRPAMGAQSRAVETTNDNLGSIYVTSFMGGKEYFNDVEFSKGTDGFYNSTATYDWPGDNTRLKFYSYSPSLDELGADITISNDTVPTLENFSVAENIADQVDFITAQAAGTRTENEETGVPLTFSHRLAQVEIRAISNNTTYVFKVAGARIGRVEYLGSFNLDTEEWTLDDWHDTAIYDTSITPVTLGSEAVSLMGDGGNAMLLPQTLTPWSPVNDPDNVARESYLSVLVNISTKDGLQFYPFPSDTQKDSSGNIRKYAWASIPLSGKWEAGKKYVYTLDFTEGAGNVDPDDPQPGNPVLGKAIKFTVNVENWSDAPSTIPMTPVRK